MLVAALAGAPSVAEQPPLRVEWNAPANCGSSEQVAARAQADLGPRPPNLGPARPPVVARGDVVVGEGGELRLTLHVDDGQTVVRRHLSATRCEALIDAAGIIIAFAIDPMATVAVEEPIVPESPPAPVIPPSPQPASNPKEDVAEEPPTDVDLPLGWEEPPVDDVAESEGVDGKRPTSVRALGVEGGVDLSVLQRYSGALGGHLSWIYPRWRISAGVLAGLPRRVGGAAPLRMWLVAGEVRGCRVLKRQSVEFPLCAGLAAGTMGARGEGVERPRTAVRPWVGAIASTGFTVAVGQRLGVFVALRGIVPMVRPSFGLGNGVFVSDSVRAPSVGGRASAGIEVRLP